MRWAFVLRFTYSLISFMAKPFACVASYAGFVKHLHPYRGRVVFFFHFALAFSVTRAPKIIVFKNYQRSNRIPAKPFSVLPYGDV